MQKARVDQKAYPFEGVKEIYWGTFEPNLIKMKLSAQVLAKQSAFVIFPLTGLYPAQKIENYNCVLKQVVEKRKIFQFSCTIGCI